MLSRMSSNELSEWVAYERVAGPLGQERDDILTALVALVIANFSGSKKRHKLDEFLPKWDRRPQSADEQLSMVKALHVMFGGRADELG